MTGDLNRSQKYRKDPASEQRIKELNDFLARFEEKPDKEYPVVKHPLVFIIGCPRTGSTLLAQLLAASGLFAYVSNFVARFWKAPAIGAKIGLALDLALMKEGSNLKSSFGQTTGWTEPHEFGYFWDRWFLYEETAKVSPAALAKIDWREMKSAFLSLQAVFAMPLFFKNQNKYSLQTGFLANLFENSYFIFIERQPLYQTQSVLLSRQEFCGSIHTWWTMKPAEYPLLKDLSPYEQVAGQTYYLTGDIDRQLNQLDKKRFIKITYEDLCASPVESVVKILNHTGIEQKSPVGSRDFKHLPATLESGNIQKFSTSEWNKLKAACQKFRLLP
jgi:hypothetical protein